MKQEYTKALREHIARLRRLAGMTDNHKELIWITNRIMGLDLALELAEQMLKD